MHNDEDEMTEEERKAQEALGTLPTFTFHIVQPLSLTLDIEIAEKVVAPDREKALKIFEELLKTPEQVVPRVRERLKDVCGGYSMHEDHTLAKSVNRMMVIGIKPEESFITAKDPRK